MSLYLRYGQTKKSISTDSEWFNLAYRHPSWFTADIARISIATPGYPLLPERKPDLYWVESKICTMLTNLIEPDLINNRLENLSRSLMSVGQIMLNLGEAFLSDEAFYFHKKLREKFFTLIPTCEKLGQIDENTRTLTAVIECSSNGLGNYIAGLNRFTSALTIEQFETRILKYFHQTKLKPSIDISLPRPVLDTIFCI